MSKLNERYSSSGFNKQKKVTKTPPKTESNPRRNQKSYDIKKKASESQSFQEIALHQKDQRFKYLLKQGDVKKIEKGGNIIFAQLPQIPNVWVCYRRPCERQTNIEKLSLDSIELSHMPLLQGQQKLKMLTLQHNKISKIQNLISLPNLLYLDLYDNQIKDIENLAIPTLKVLLLPKNQITRIKCINQLVKLEVLDLHSNRITRIQGFGILNSIRILNLSHNQISQIENLDNLTNLTELNLKTNLITIIQNIKHLSKVEKLFLANNRIQIKHFESCQLLRLNNLKELSLENNPFSKQKIPYLRNIIKYLGSVKTLDGKTPTLMEDGGSSNEQSDHAQVLTLISTQWEQQKSRIDQIELSNGSKRQFLKSTCITGGHAQIEDQTILFIYGNSYDVVLTNQNFQQNVEKIRFQYIFIEFLIEPNILTILKKFRKLKILQFRNTYIMSLLQIAKLENLNNLKIIIIQPSGNPISQCSFVKQFIIYRFPNIIQVNKEDIKQQDRAKAKLLFQNFDKVLQIPEKVYGPQTMRNFPFEEPNAKKDRNYLKNFNKVINQSAQAMVAQRVEKIEKSFQSKSTIEEVFDAAMIQLIRKVKNQMPNHIK